MSATRPTFGEIRFQCAKRLPGVDPDVLDSFINERYRRSLRRLNWRRLRVQSVLQTVAEYTTGTVAVTNGSTAITGTGTVWTSAMSGRAIRFGEDDAYYQFTYASGTTGTLDRAYEGTTDTDATYTIWQAVYVMPTDMAQLHTMRVLGSALDLDQVSQEDLDEIDPTRSFTGSPERYAIHMDDTSTPPRVQVELHPGPDEALGIPFWYTQDPEMFGASDTSDFMAPWLNPDEIYLGVEADVRRLEKDYTGAQLAEQLAGQSAAESRQAEHRRTGPQRIKMAAQWTRHNRNRWQDDF